MLISWHWLCTSLLQASTISSRRSAVSRLRWLFGLDMCSERLPIFGSIFNRSLICESCGIKRKLRSRMRFVLLKSTHRSSKRSPHPIWLVGAFLSALERQFAACHCDAVLDTHRGQCRQRSPVAYCATVLA